MPAHKHEQTSDPPSFIELAPYEAWMREQLAAGVTYQQLRALLIKEHGIRYAVGTLNKFLNRNKDEGEAPSGLFDGGKANGTMGEEQATSAPGAAGVSAPMPRAADPATDQASGHRELETLRDRVAEMHAQMTAMQADKAARMEAWEDAVSLHDLLPRGTSEAMDESFDHPIFGSSGDRAWDDVQTGTYTPLVIPGTGRDRWRSVGQGILWAMPVLAILAALVALAWFGQAAFVGVFGRLTSLAGGGVNALLVMLEQAEQQVIESIARVNASPLIPVGLVLGAVVWFFGLRSILRTLLFLILLLWCLNAGHYGLSTLLGLIALLWWRRG